jgi:hypothetical protein
MSFAEQQLQIGAKQPCHQFKLCGKCQQDKPPEGGIEMGGKWMCAGCWTRRSAKKNLLQNRHTKNA